MFNQFDSTTSNIKHFSSIESPQHLSYVLHPLHSTQHVNSVSSILARCLISLCSVEKHASPGNRIRDSLNVLDRESGANPSTIGILRVKGLFAQVDIEVTAVLLIETHALLDSTLQDFLLQNFIWRFLY